MTTEAQIRGLGEFGRRAFTLEHDGAMAVFLLHEGERIATFSQTGATPESIQGICANHLVMKHGWDGCLWSRKKGGDARNKRVLSSWGEQANIQERK